MNGVNKMAAHDMKVWGWILSWLDNFREKITQEHAVPYNLQFRIATSNVK
jgi:hypothetical protein